MINERLGSVPNARKFDTIGCRGGGSINGGVPDLPSWVLDQKSSPDFIREMKHRDDPPLL